MLGYAQSWHNHHLSEILGHGRPWPANSPIQRVEHQTRIKKNPRPAGEKIIPGARTSSENGAKTYEILTKWLTTTRRLRRRPKGEALRAAPLGFLLSPIW